MQNYQIQAGTLLESFETIGDWTDEGTAGGSIAVDPTIFTEGAGSLKITSVNGNYYATKTISVDLSRAGVIAIDVYFEDITKTTSGTLYLSSTTNFSKYFSVSLKDLRNGWNKLYIFKNLWTNTASEDWANLMIRMRVRLNATATTSCYFDNLKYGIYNRPKVVWTADDGRITQYTELFAYAKKYRLRGTLFPFGTAIGSGASYMTLAQITEMYNAGWDVCNHTYNHTNLTTLATQAEMETELALMKTYLQDNGFTRNNALKLFCYPYGAFNDTVEAAAAAQGFVCIRPVLANANCYQVPGDRSELLIVRNLGASTTLASIKTDVDQCIASGSTLIIESHSFVAPAVEETEFPIADMQALLDYIQSKAQQIDMVTLSEWYKGLTQPRKDAEI